jgi:hypothetical protein
MAKNQAEWECSKDNLALQTIRQIAPECSLKEVNVVYEVKK